MSQVLCLVLQGNYLINPDDYSLKVLVCPIYRKGREAQKKTKLLVKITLLGKMVESNFESGQCDVRAHALLY